MSIQLKFLIKSNVVYFIKLILLAVGYALLAKLSLTYFHIENVNVSLIWPSSGLALGALLIGGKKYWPGVFAGAFAAGLMVGDSILMLAFIALGNTLEPLIGRWLLMRSKYFKLTFNSTTDYVTLAAFGGLSVLSSALIGSATLAVSGTIPHSTMSVVLLNWWMGDILGIVLITPLILIWRVLPRDGFSYVRVIEAIIIFGLMLVAGQALFNGWLSNSVGSVVDLYWMFPFLAWVAVRFGIHGVTLALTATAIQALWSLSHGVGHFANAFEEIRLLNFWFYEISLSFVSISLALVMREQKFPQIQRKFLFRGL